MLSSFKNIEPLVASIEHLAASPERYRDVEQQRTQVSTALNGHLSKTLRDVVPSATLQNFGAYFTSDSMADQLISDLSDDEIAMKSVLDASCGGGNLLLAYARRLPLHQTLNETIALWGEKLFGVDIQQEFVRSTRARLILLAFQRGYEKFGSSFFNEPIPDISKAFSNIVLGDSLSIDWPDVDIILLNPPYNRVPVDNGCEWATGRVSNAAKFMIKAAYLTSRGSSVRAILPDVLRSGSNYKSWRREISNLSAILDTKILGQFDADTGVDVFSIILAASAPEPAILNEDKSNWNKIIIKDDLKYAGYVKDKFLVSVGRVVPHRDAELGEEYPYIHAKGLSPWKTIKAGKEKRRFSGTTFKPPFVVIRRSSRSQDLHRAVATVIRAGGERKSRIAVENHLIVVQPKSGLLRDCKALASLLKREETDAWLNQRIRCRHLTVSAINELPWWI